MIPGNAGRLADRLHSSRRILIVKCLTWRIIQMNTAVRINFFGRTSALLIARYFQSMHGSIGIRWNA